MSDPIRRRSGRAIVIDRADRVLLMEVANPADPEGDRFWVTPGGGAEAGETLEDAVRRELFEETGIDDADWGPSVWCRDIDWTWNGKAYTGHEVYFVCRVDRPILDASRLEPYEQRDVQAFRWWGLNEIRASDDRFSPEGLADLLVPVLAGDYPEAPIPLSPLLIG